MALKVAFVAGYCPIKLPQKLGPLHALEEVESIDLFIKRRYEDSDIPKLRWVYIPGFFGIAVFQELARLVILLASARKYDLIIACHQTYHGVWAWLAGKLWSKPVIQMVITDVDWVHAKFFPSIAMLAAAACGVRGPVAAEKLRKLGFKNQIETLHNTISTMPQLPDGVAVDKIEKRFDLLAVASYAKEKDLPWMLEVMAETVKIMPGIKLAVAGNGQEPLKALIREKCLDSNIELLGPVYGKDLALLYNQSRAFIMTSETEGLPMVVLEAFAFGLPVFVSDAGELSWLVRDGIDGRVIHHGNTSKMSESLIDAFKDLAILDRMGKNAQSRFEILSSEFSTERISECWKRLIDAALKNNGELKK
ncbi:MAG: hypothetical protein A2020_10860 [Lentisphaerae bacterium GWF2_45_14]|nr:MAG: hypothetical protein A2020_10860 [Lentisphaerae bacterium GWF2_45_14]